MRFLLKALFFLAVVAAFIPREPGAEAAPTLAMAEPKPAAAGGGFCDRQQAVCDMAAESAQAARILGDMALEQVGRGVAEAAMNALAAQTGATQAGAAQATDAAEVQPAP